MDRYAVVTGAGSGIGRAVAQDLLVEGWTVFSVDLTAPGDPHGVIGLSCDVADEAAVSRAFAEIARQAPRIDALVCSAGVLRSGAVSEMSVADYDLTFGVNTRGPWLCLKAALPMLRAAATNGALARVVMLASIAAIRPKVDGGVYAASKAALVQLTRVLGAELAGEGIRVNALGPGSVDTPMIRARMETSEGYRVSGPAPIGRVARPEDIAAAVRWLLSDGGDFVTGAFIPVDGGTSAAFRG